MGPKNKKSKGRRQKKDEDKQVFTAADPQQEVYQLTATLPPIPCRTQRNVQILDNIAATWNTNILIDIGFVVPDKIIDADAEHTSNNYLLQFY